MTIHFQESTKTNSIKLPNNIYGNFYLVQGSRYLTSFQLSIRSRYENSLKKPI